jgi:hypothetical protein
MKVLLSVISLVLLVTLYNPVSDAQTAPQVVNIDQKLTVNVENITLGRLLRLWDQATGTHSSVPPELANRIVSVRFSKLPLEEAVQKIFQDLPFDYVFVRGQGIMITGLSQKHVPPQPAVVQSAPPINNVNVNAVQRMKPEARTPSPAEIVNSPSPAEIVNRTPPPPQIVPTPFGPIEVSPEGSQIMQLPPVDQGPAPPFFGQVGPPTPPAGAPNGPGQNSLFGPISIYPNTAQLPPLGPPPASVRP